MSECKHKKLKSLLFRVKLLLFIPLLLFSCSYDDPEPRAHLPDYFGFVLIDTFVDDPSDQSTSSNYLEEVAHSSNISDLLPHGPDEDLSDRLTLFRQKDQAVLLHVFDLFFEFTVLTQSGRNNYDLREDYSERWSQFVSLNKTSLDEVDELILYLGEEAFWNLVTFTELEIVAKLIDQSFPDASIAIIEAAPAIDEMQIPSEVDWVGFDQYFIKDPNTNADFQESLAHIKSKMNANQELVIVMDAHFYPVVHEGVFGISMDEMGAVAENYFMLAQEERAIALLGYHWPSGFEDESVLGARGMPANIRDIYKEMGQEILAK